MQNEEQARRAVLSQMAPKPAAAPAAAAPGAAPAAPPKQAGGISEVGGIVGPRPGSAAPPASPLAGIDQSKWDTDGFSAPGAIKAGKGGAMSGWDQTKWADANNQHPKYVVGRILSNFEDTPEGLTKAMPDIMAAYPGAKQVGDDKIDIPGVGTVDVGVGFSGGGHHGWAWNTGDGGGNAGGGGGQASLAGGGGFPGLVPTDDSFFKKLLSQAQGAVDDPAASGNRNALLSLLNQG
jgi:hypothetical protein